DDNPDSRIPIRLTRGPLDFRMPESALPPDEAAWFTSKDFPLNGDQRFELVNFIDGKNSVEDVRNAVSAEFTPVASLVISRYIDDLVKAGVVKWK
ncbi:MAG TPA: hypothetical protein VKI62_09405, partial [Bacteroidota bacterium]|nr:hypothetical protein [Bacteroidota bacterium]